MKILLASSEVHPYSKTGGLADMAGALGRALAKQGHRVGIVTPLFQGIREKCPDIKRFEWQLDLPMGMNWVHGEVWTLEPAKNLTIYFIHQPAYYDRRGLYQETGGDYWDNAERFIFLSKAAVHLARYLPWQPEVVHVHDWQTGLVPLLIKHQQMREGWGTAPRVCFTIHNLAYQGHFPAAAYALTNLPPDHFNPGGAEFHGLLNCLKAGISFADVITTVSPRYAREITTEAFGAGLDGILRHRQDSLVGILNGVDYDEWKTKGNPFLNYSYGPRNMKGKASEKADLQMELGLAIKPEIPLFGNITRLVDQKGVDILLAALEEMLPADLQFVLLGSGAREFETAFQRLAARYPRKVAVKIGYDQALSHRIEAGADFYLMPSRFEPCGLNQMYSLRYGTIPIVRVTGGLDDSVIDIGEDPSRANGIKFVEYSGRALAKAIRKALVLYGDKALFRQYRRSAMSADFSWSRTCEQYLECYRGTTPDHP